MTRCSVRGPSSVSFCYPASSLLPEKQSLQGSSSDVCLACLHLVKPLVTSLPSLPVCSIFHLFGACLLSVCLSVCMSVCRSVGPSVCLCLPAWLSVCLPACLSVCLPACVPPVRICPPRPTYLPMHLPTYPASCLSVLAARPLEHEHMLQGPAPLQVNGGLHRQMSAAWSTPQSYGRGPPLASLLMGGPSIWQSLPGPCAPPLWDQRCMVGSTSCRSSLQSWRPDCCCSLHSRALSR